MEQLIRNLCGVAVYMDDILVSGNNVKEHLENFWALTERLKRTALQPREVHLHSTKC